MHNHFIASVEVWLQVVPSGLQESIWRDSCFRAQQNLLNNPSKAQGFTGMCIGLFLT